MTSKALSERERAVRALVDEELSARHAGDVRRAVDLCRHLLAILDPSERRWVAFANNELGYIHHFLLHDPHAAEPYFVLAVAASPKSEIASLGLFHSRARQEKWSDALAEAARFVDHSDSPEYRALFSESYVNGFTADDRQLARQIFERLSRKN